MAKFEGNTNSNSATCKIQRLYFCFTFFYDNEDEIERLDEKLKGFCKYFIYGKENCPTTSKKHLQGFMKLDKKRRFLAVKKLCPQSIHLEVCKGGEKDNLMYCKKDGDWIEWTKPIEYKYPITEDERILMDRLINSVERVISVPTQSDNFMMNLYTTYQCGYFHLRDMAGLRNLGMKKGMIIMLSFSCLISEDEKFGILGAINRGHFNGVVFDSKYIITI